MTGHGDRSLFMGVCKQELKYKHEPVNCQLSHLPDEETDKAYDRDDYIEERKIMMQKFADYIDKKSPKQPKGHHERAYKFTTTIKNYHIAQYEGSLSKIEYKPIQVGQRCEIGKIPEAQEEWKIEQLDGGGNSSLH
ncbi:MAG: hypothetical protein ACQUHE_06650 [Bacteroidia bacterium]